LQCAGTMQLSVRTRLTSTLLLGVAAATSCGGGGNYAGLTRDEATKLAKARIEATLDPTKRPYYETSIWNVAAVHGQTAEAKSTWVIGIWNGQADRGDCALARRSDGLNHVRLISCAEFPKYSR
jgi:hypothetical protein